MEYNWITLVFSGLVTLSTIVYAILTWMLVGETKTLRKSETEPALAVYLNVSDRWINALDIIVENCGKGMAKEIRWEFSPTLDNINKENLGIRHVRLFENLPQLAPSQKIKCFFGLASELFADPVLPIIEVKAFYKSDNNEEIVSSFLLDASQFYGIRSLGEDPVESSAKSIKKISEALSAIIHRGKLED